ncbi:NAD-dependent epimerase/dehydratase family protein [Agromyces protaetiae]|uniref:NAD-dependent epimerase/dehydratase family protein n=1 Tax=Agromyces protaetiae TaxID=2509455 RepID=A0A4P6FF71_9MICO|nr:NAD-dependent epimerase/dehydratase family protein [Agromyces protaetiae]QAY74585.1 NAD-dependent epimerase/dehydratase family protein [Agromyces protaetiae]
MRVLVTGAAGFIGSTTAEALLGRGHDVVGIDSFTDYYDPARKRRNAEASVAAGVRFVEGDLLTLPLDDLLADVEVVIHLAGQPGVRASWGESFDEYLQLNVHTTQRLLEASRRADITRFVYASSSSVYGQADSYPTDESMLPRPFSPYGVTKLAGEHLVSLYRENYGLPTVSFRFFTVYGPRQRPDMAFSRFFASAIAGAPVTVYGDGTQIRDFTFVGDVADALLRVSAHDGPLPPVMNLAGGSSVTVLEVLDTIAAITGRRVDIEHLPTVNGDVFRTGGVAHLARETLGWTPRTALANGLRAQFDWIVEASSTR